MNISAILSVSVILFSVIDIIGNLPVILNLKKNGVEIKPSLATAAAALIMIGFLLFGATLLGVLGIDVSSFALAGSLIILFIGLEMILGIEIFRDLGEKGSSGSIVPIAFPLLAGAGTLTTILSLKADYDSASIAIGILVNLLFIYIVLRSSDWLSRKIPAQVVATMRKTVGVLLIAIAIQMFKTHWS